MVILVSFHIPFHLFIFGYTEPHKNIRITYLSTLAKVRYIQFISLFFVAINIINKLRIPFAYKL